MYITPLIFNKVLDWFYSQQDYKLMLLFVRSFDCNDKGIVKEVVDNVRRISKLACREVYFFYFIKERYEWGIINDVTNGLVHWIMNMKDRFPMYGSGISVTMETADDIFRKMIFDFLTFLHLFCLTDRF